MKKRLVIANWKMYIHSPDAAKSLFPCSAQVGRPLRRRSVGSAAVYPAPGVKVKLGGQTLSSYADGAHTGEISRLCSKPREPLCYRRSLERRTLGDTNEDVHAQLAAAAGAGVVPVLCVGETARSADGAHFSLLEEQLASALRGAQSLPRNSLSRTNRYGR